MAVEGTEPLDATVIALTGKYVVLDVGVNDGVQVGDIFDDGEETPITHTNGSKITVRGVTAELYVERVFPEHCLTVMTYAMKMPYFDDAALLKDGEYVVRKGHPHRLTASGSLIGPKSV